jgi:hypothetical protein
VISKTVSADGSTASASPSPPLASLVRRSRLTSDWSRSASSSPTYWSCASVWPPPAVSRPTLAIPSTRPVTDWLMSTFWMRRSGISRSRRENTPERMSNVSAVSSYS